ncbi:hypothetical protein QW131_13210 [Roseibium salinum]|nr:hypothetical protein [Roseibium salinum]
MKLYDCFVFHNEFDLLELRLREMGDHVDHFVLVEANQTQRGGAKPYYFDENRERFAPWADKIIDLQIAFPDELPPALGVYKNRRKKRTGSGRTIRGTASPRLWRVVTATM